MKRPKFNYKYLSIGTTSGRLILCRFFAWYNQHQGRPLGNFWEPLAAQIGRITWMSPVGSHFTRESAMAVEWEDRRGKGEEGALRGDGGADGHCMRLMYLTLTLKNGKERQERGGIIVECSHFPLPTLLFILSLLHYYRIFCFLLIMNTNKSGLLLFLFHTEIRFF